jgi:TonB-dependent SusC/RagA subfamily outer membrane receptor
LQGNGIEKHLKIMSFQKSLLCTLLFLSGWLLAMTQDNKQKLDNIAGGLLRKLQLSEGERIFVHHDKPWYQSGSTIWFKVYLYKSNSQQASTSRNNVYVELLDQRDSIVQQLILNSVNREWDGGLLIPSKLPEGFYTLRAWNGGSANNAEPATQAGTSNVQVGISRGIFADAIYIVQNKNEGSPGTVATGPAPAPGKPIARFYPEGGSLVNGLDNQVAVHVTDEKGDPISGSGQIWDDNDRKMTDFKTDSSGWGMAVFAPYKNRSYKAVYKSSEGQTVNTALPPINYRAAQLSVLSQDEAKVKLRVVLGDSIYSQKPASYLLGTARGVLHFAAMGNGMFELDLPLDKFPEGPATIHLFNDQEQEMSRRTILVKRKSLDVQTKADKENYAARQKATISIDIKDKSGNPLTALLSVSVTDDRMVDQRAQQPAWGEVASGPALLATGASASTALSNGISVGPTAASTGTSNASPADTALEIRGRVVGADGNAVAGQVVTVLAEGTNLVLSDTSDAEGRFVFSGLDFPEKSPFIAQVRDLQGQKKNVTVTLDQGSSRIPGAGPGQSSSGLPIAQSYHNTGQREALRNFRLQQADSVLTGTTPVMLEGIIVKGSKKREGRADVALKSASSRIITAEQLDKLNLGTTVNAVMMLPGVIMVGGQLTIRGGLQTTAGGASGLEPLLIIDGVPYTGGGITSTLNSINPQLIESIEVITGGEAARYGSRAANGVILVKTSNNLRVSQGTDDRGMQYIFPGGYHVKPEFYAPPYDVYGVREATFTDNRSTIYWNGELATDKNGKAQFSFFTADLSGTYTIRVVGITSKGDLVDESILVHRR